MNAAPRITKSRRVRFSGLGVGLAMVVGWVSLASPARARDDSNWATDVSTPSCSGPSVRPEDFAATSADPQGLQAAFDAVQPGGQVVLTGGQTYRHPERVLHIHTAGICVIVQGGGQVVVEGSTTASPPEDFPQTAVSIEADGVTVSGNINFKTVGVAKRYYAFQQMGVRIAGVRGTTLDGITVEGAAAAGIYVGFSDGEGTARRSSSYYLIKNVTVKNTWADGIHQTGGSNHGHVVAPNVFWDGTTPALGDDGVAVVSYNQDGVISHDIVVDDPVVSSNRHGRGITVSGGSHITYNNPRITSSDAAAVFVGQEPAGGFDTMPASNVAVVGGTLTNSNRSNIDNNPSHGAVLVWSAQNNDSADGVSNVTIANLAVNDTNPAAPRNIGLLTENGGRVAHIAFSNIAVTHGPTQTWWTNAPWGTYSVIGLLQDGLAVLIADLLGPSPSPSPTGPVPTCDGRPATVQVALGQVPTAGDDVIVGTAGNDSISGGGGNDVICGMGGNDSLRGGSGNDRILGGDGDDSLYGESGDDTLFGGAGTDKLVGGSGADAVYGGSGTDLVTYSSSTSGVNVTLDNRANDGASADGHLDNIHTDVEQVDGSPYADRLTGSSAANRLYGSGGADVLIGAGGSDRLSGGSGRDALDGGYGNDAVYGGPGPDTLSGGPGADTLYGGDGNDSLRARDGVRDSLIDGGAGSDQATRDGGDPSARRVP